LTRPAGSNSGSRIGDRKSRDRCDVGVYKFKMVNQFNLLANSYED